MRAPSNASAGFRPRLYHAPSSYYSMIARLALAEGGMACESVFVDIHARLEQQHPDYVRLNPNMTVPTLALPDRVLADSRDIAAYALGAEAAAPDEETRAWLEWHDALPIEELTFGRLLARNAVARVMIPKALERARRNLLAQAARTPELAPLYAARAELFARRIRTFDPDAAIGLARLRSAQAVELCERMQRALDDGRATLAPAGYGLADTVLTVFLARLELVGLGEEAASRPALARYWRAMRLRPSFAEADIWTRFHAGRLIAGLLGFHRHRAA
jgi:glutathione S-transferase